jgi:hypothetical protein
MINGATFYFLDGYRPTFPSIIHNLDTHKPKLFNLLNAYKSAGVNWIRILIVCQHFGDKLYHPDDPYTKPEIHIQKVNEFMRFANTVAPFTFEVLLDPRKTWPTTYFQDTPLYANDKVWYDKWISRLDFSTLGVIMLPGDLWPIQGEYAFGDHHELVSPVCYNNGHWIKEMMGYLHSKYPTMHINFELGLWGTTPETVKKAVSWHTKYFPWTWWIAMPLYYSLPPGATWQEYRTGFSSLFSAYKQATSKPLWIDEYGLPITITPAGYYEEDQEAYYHGILEAMKESGIQHARFAWVAGRDYPYNGAESYGLVKSFSSDTPVWTPAWDQVKAYYK